MSEAPLQPGTVLLGKYRIERELGTGGMGVVVEATHLMLGQRVAIKLLNAELVSSPEIIARFLREARIAAQLESDHIARVSDIGQIESGAPYIVMELLVGHDLEAELVRRGRLPISEAVDLILQACVGLADAHAVGLVHRDIKPANLFLARRANRPPLLKVLDFGLSKESPQGSAVSLTTTDSVFGTPQYMSPEQVVSAKKVDARSDQHALAMILYELLTGTTAYEAESVTQLIVVIATHPPPHACMLRPEVPFELDLAIARALAKQAAQRFPDLAAFANAIAPFGGAEAAQMAQNVRAALGAATGASAGLGAAETASGPSSGPDETEDPSEDDVTIQIPFRFPRRTPAQPQPYPHPYSAPVPAAPPQKRSRFTRRVALAGGVAVIAAGAALAIALLWSDGDPEAAPPAEGAPPPAGSAAPAPE
jgi:serine/threonine-protein kinase